MSKLSSRSNRSREKSHADSPVLDVHRLDVSGTYCPVPILMTGRVIHEVEPGARLEVLGDDPTMEKDFPIWCEESGHRLLSLEKEGKRVRVLIEAAG